MPSTSGANAHAKRSELTEHLRAARAVVSDGRGLAAGLEA
jgi:hypothetical protein